MKAQLHSELLKLRTTRIVAAFLLAVVALTLLTVPVEGFSTELGELTTESMQRTLIGDYGASNAVLLSTFVGLLLVTSEFRYGTIRPTLLFDRAVASSSQRSSSQPRSPACVFAVVCVALSFGAGLAVLAARDVDVALTGTHALVLVFGPVAASAGTAMLGVAIGALIRNQVGAIIAAGRLHPRDRSPDLRCDSLGRPLSPGTGKQRAGRDARRRPSRAGPCRRRRGGMDARLRRCSDRANRSQRRVEAQTKRHNRRRIVTTRGRTAPVPFSKRWIPDDLRSPSPTFASDAAALWCCQASL